MEHCTYKFSRSYIIIGVCSITTLRFPTLFVLSNFRSILIVLWWDTRSLVNQMTYVTEPAMDIRWMILQMGLKTKWWHRDEKRTYNIWHIKWFPKTPQTLKCHDTGNDDLKLLYYSSTIRRFCILNSRNASYDGMWQQYGISKVVYVCYDKKKLQAGLRSWVMMIGKHDVTSVISI